MTSAVNVKIKGTEHVSKIEFNGNTFIVQTEDLGAKSAKIVTRTYQAGTIVDTKTADYTGIPSGVSLKEKIRDLMNSQHLAAVEALSRNNRTPQKSKAEFAVEINSSLRKKNRKAALESAKEALSLFPEDPFFLSHLGHLIATVERRSKEGCAACEKAISIIARSVSEDKDYFYPLFYLNLGKACLAGRQKRAALNAFYTGLKYDTDNKELLSSIQNLGQRRPPVISFLGRSHPLNKYLGIIRHRLLSGKEI
jgi:tetratricopeptide (TPR) repeat protein